MNRRDDLDFPSDVVYRNRVSNTQNLMQKNGIDILLLAGKDFHNYLSGLFGVPSGRPIWLVLPQLGTPAFVSPRSEAKEIRARCETPVEAEWVEWVETPPTPMTHHDALSKYLAEIAPLARLIGLDFNSVSAANLELVKQALGDKRISDSTPMMRQLLACKDGPAIACIRNGCDIVGKQFEACSKVIAPSIPEWEVTLASVTASIRRHGELLGADAERPRFWPHQMNMVGSGADRTARCHCSGGGRIMEDGELVQICFCGEVFCGHGVCFDRPIAVGSKPLSADLRKIIRIAREAQEAALATVRPGAISGDVHAAALAVIERGGWDRPFLHRTGRGIGYSDWDGLDLKAGDQTTLKAGMVLSVEPGVYVDRVGGARFGDTVLVTEAGCEVLTPFTLGREVTGEHDYSPTNREDDI